MIEAGSGAPVHPNAGNGHALTVFAPKATFQTVRLSCFLELADLQSMGLWEWLEEQGLATPALEALGRLGTPLHVHAVPGARDRPRGSPAPDAARVHKAAHLPLRSVRPSPCCPTRSGSTGRAAIKLDVLSKWEEPFDDGVNPLGSVYCSTTHRWARSRSASEQPPPISVDDAGPGLRHDFGDTKHRLVYYEAQATTSFLEYFVETDKVTLHGTAPTVVNAGGLATGATTVKSIGTPAITYQPTVDYIEDDAAGTIARTPTSAIKLHTAPPTVDVSFVPPPVTRSSLEKVVPPATSSGLPAVGPELGAAGCSRRALCPAVVRLRHQVEPDEGGEPPRSATPCASTSGGPGGPPATANCSASSSTRSRRGSSRRADTRRRWSRSSPATGATRSG